MGGGVMLDGTSPIAAWHRQAKQLRQYSSVKTHHHNFSGPDAAECMVD